VSEGHPATEGRRSGSPARRSRVGVKVRGDVDGTYSEAVLGTLTAEERAALAAWLRAQGVAPHRRGMAPRPWVPVSPPEPGWWLEAPLAPGRKPVYRSPPTPGVSPPDGEPGRAYPLTETQVAYAHRLRRERAARAARGEPEPETRHDRHHMRPRDEAAAEDAARRLGAALRAWREARGLSQTELARRLEMPRPNVARLEAGALFPGLAVLQRLARVTGVAVRVDVTPTAIAVALDGAAA
jgi:ribosome-binding protein aMBF1 (putative translation factor)